MASAATDVFLSYKAEDRSRLVPFVSALEGEGFTVWWDAHIGGGTNWHEDIERHLDAAKCVIVAWSRRSVGHDGHFVRDEARRSQRRGAYIPVCIDKVDPPLGFGEIQAIPLKGWKGDRDDPRFRAVADAVRSHLSGEQVPRSAVEFREPPITRRAAIAGGTGVVTLAAAAGGWFFLKPAPANAKRIAVMPFDNLSGDPNQAYFAEGIAEELRGALSRVGLQVIGRSSSRAVRDMDAKAAAAKLGVGNILTGSVRRSPQMVRISAQLIGGSDGVQRWARSYDRAPGDAIKIQTDIAASVAQALSLALSQAGRAALTLGGTTDSIAQDLVLQSRQLGRKGTSIDSFRRRLALAEAAIDRDPNYAAAYVEKAKMLVMLSGISGPTPAEYASELAQAEMAARRATALAPRLGSVHTALAAVESARLNFAGVLRETDAALALSPEDPLVLGPAASNLALLGNREKAIRVADRAVALDPLDARSQTIKANVLFWSRRYEQALEAGRKTLEMSPEHLSTHLVVGDAMLLLGQAANARNEYGKMDQDDALRWLRLSVLIARSADHAEAERNLAQLKRQIGASSSYQYAQIRAQLGDTDPAFAELDNAVDAKDPGLILLKVDPFLDPIRGDPRYSALLKRLSFPTST